MGVASGVADPQPTEIPIKSDMIRMGGRSIEALLLEDIFYPFYPLGSELRMWSTSGLAFPKG
jgi:hypothetical protein